MDAPPEHTTVLLQEAVSALLEQSPESAAPAADGVYVDATFGRGGHSRRVLSLLSPQGRLVAFDRDPQAAAQAGTSPTPVFPFGKRAFRIWASWPRPLWPAF